MIHRLTPFKLTTHFRGWSRVLAIGLALSTLLNLALVYANVKQSENLSIPRVVMNTPSGIILPVAASAFVWTPEVAATYLKLFLPVLYTYSQAGPPAVDSWSPFINQNLLKSAVDRWQKNSSQIQADGLNQTLLVREVRYNPEEEQAAVIAELRRIDRNGQITKTPLALTVGLTTTADPLNPYGHMISNVH